MKIKICSLSMMLFCAHVNSEVGQPKTVEKLGAAKVHEIHMTKKQMAAADKSVAESFDQGFTKSSPEVQNAILETAKELEAKPFSTEESTEQ